LHLAKLPHVAKILNGMNINRDSYLNQLIEAQGNNLIKIITGIRRCGKSFLLFELFYKHLKDSGIDDNHIIQVDLEDIRNIELHDPIALVKYIDKQIVDNSQYYILLDEVQYVDKFEDVLNSYLKKPNVDVYVTGSNSKFLSSDIATRFRGRGDEIHVYPLSFSEYYEGIGGDIYLAWQDYLVYGGLPQILFLKSDQSKQQYLKNLCNTVYIKDLQERNKIQKTAEFEQLITIMASTIGAPCNPTKLANTYKTAIHSAITPQTITTYLKYYQDAFMLEKAQRYDVKGRKYINSLSKYYFSDMGIRNALLDFRQQEETHIMENIIYNELRIRGYSVDVGIVETKYRDENQSWQRKQLEVDFVATLGSKCYYIQSALALPDEEKRRQESASLRNIKDNFRKIIIVKERIKPWYDANGILTIGLFDFLLNREVIDF
jgi:hypothetical protein